MATRSLALLAASLSLTAIPAAHAQVFTVGEKTATAGISTDFKPTNLSLPPGKLSERGRRDLVRNLEAEQGFAHRALPVGVISLRANGDLFPGPDRYREMIYQKGQSAGPGDRVAITALTIKGNEITLDLNGGPYAKHRFLSHVSLNDAPVAAQPADKPTGSRITLVFPDGIPEISAPEVKALLEPLIDFGVKTGEQAYADTLPPRLKEAIAAHEVLVGMNRRMVLASLGAPERKTREADSGDPNGTRYEEWIYGHVPQTVKFVRFKGDQVAVVEIAAMGKPIEIHDKNELQPSEMPDNTRTVAMGDHPGKDGEEAASKPPSLRLPGEAEAPPSAQGKVQYPGDKTDDKDKDRRLDRQPIPAAPGSPADTSSNNPLSNDPTLQDPSTGVTPASQGGVPLPGSQRPPITGGPQYPTSTRPGTPSTYPTTH